MRQRRERQRNPDNSEIDIEILCGTPNVISMTTWTDYQAAPERFLKWTRAVDRATGLSGRPGEMGPSSSSRPEARANIAPMSTTARRVHYTYQEYLALEEGSSVRHEYLQGEIYAMAGGSPDHAALAARLIRALGAQLRPGCQVFTSDLRVRIPGTGLTTYPDVSVVCGRTLRAAEDPLAVVNPVLLAEVTSDSTEDYDRGEKLRHYKDLPSVREVLVLSHRGPRISVHRRDDGSWTSLDAGPGETVALSPIAGSVAVDDLYRDGLEDASG